MLVETRYRVLDFAVPADDTALQVMVRAGVDGVVRYLASPKPEFDWKRVTGDEIGRVHSKGLMLYLVLQDVGNSLNHFTYSQGKAHGEIAAQLCLDFGVPRWLPVFYAVDVGVSHDQAHHTVVQYFNGVYDAQVAAGGDGEPLNPLGAYGGYELVRCAQWHWRVVPFLWQTAAWSPRAGWLGRGAPIELPGVHGFQHATGSFAQPEVIDAYRHDVDLNVFYFRGWLPQDTLEGVPTHDHPHGHRWTVTAA